MKQAEWAAETGPEPIPFATGFVRSEAFKVLFRDGMNLVEETAGYLDGDGRTESNRLPKEAALAYASESMRLTTRLMQIASWLLVQRAVAEGEITNAQAQREKERVRLVPQGDGTGERDLGLLPERLRDLAHTSLRFHARIMHLDRLIGGSAGVDRVPSTVAAQRGLIEAAFRSRVRLVRV